MGRVEGLVVAVPERMVGMEHSSNLVYAAGTHGVYFFEGWVEMQ